MAVKPLEFHQAAAAELESAFDWYLARDERVAAGFLDEANRAIELISQAPHRWPLSQGDVRKFVLRRFPFLFLYRELPSMIQVIAVAHGHRRPGYWKRRL
jgi:plasmid stabilization system protein ParE